MDGFNFLFEAFVLLMGLAMAEVLRGFSRVLKLRARRKAKIVPDAETIRIGWLVPLLLFSKRKKVDIALLCFVIFITLLFAVATIGQVQPG